MSHIYIGFINKVLFFLAERTEVPAGYFLKEEIFQHMSKKGKEFKVDFFFFLGFAYIYSVRFGIAA